MTTTIKRINGMYFGTQFRIEQSDDGFIGIYQQNGTRGDFIGGFSVFAEVYDGKARNQSIRIAQDLIEFLHEFINKAEIELKKAQDAEDTRVRALSKK